MKSTSTSHMLFLSMLLLLVSLLIRQETTAQANDNSLSRREVKQIALPEVIAFLKKIPSGAEEQYGFANRSEFLRASLGEPYQVYTIDPDSIRDGTPLGKQYMIPIDEWRTPIIVDGRYCSFVTVSRVDGRPRAVEIGGAVLAKEVGEFEQRHPKGLKAILRLFQLQCDYIVVISPGKKVDDGAFYPLLSARLVFRGQAFEKESNLSLSKLLPIVREKYTEQLWLDK